MGAAPAGVSAAPPNPIDVIEVSGRLDPVLADFLTDALRSAERGGSQALVVQLDSPGSVLSARDLNALVARVRRSRVPVGVWVGPSGARAGGGAARLVRAAATAAVAPGSHVAHSADSTIGGAAPTLGDFIVGLDGRTIGGRRLSTARVVQRGGVPRRQPSVEVRFAKLGLLARLLHAVASPSVAYLLVAVGLLLIVFEFFTVGIGLAGAAGAGCLVLAAYGLAVLPTRPAAVALLTVGVGGYAVDVQAGAPRVWTAVGTAALVAGSWLLYRGVSLPLLTSALTVLGVALFMLAAMPATVRARFSTPTIGRDSMVGELGQATAALDPDGTVRVRDALWRARTNRATPIAQGEAVRVVGLEGLVLQVEPAGRGEEATPA